MLESVTDEYVSGLAGAKSLMQSFISVECTENCVYALSLSIRVNQFSLQSKISINS